ncbi:uncharacterized protein LOC135164130 [Diachasmimorpha longicaudata]|uniref:uncharacterized protein LOC135164130 n=1 Tax=Diachasmimorpha longicaudata TaxID=58733 RepID=UPI0030B917D0
MIAFSTDRLPGTDISVKLGVSGVDQECVSSRGNCCWATGTCHLPVGACLSVLLGKMKRFVAVSFSGRCGGVKMTWEGGSRRQEGTWEWSQGRFLVIWNGDGEETPREYPEVSNKDRETTEVRD